MKCNLEVDGHTTDEIMIKYLRITLSSYGDVEKVIKNQIKKANIDASYGCF